MEHSKGTDAREPAIQTWSCGRTVTVQRAARRESSEDWILEPQKHENDAKQKELGKRFRQRTQEVQEFGKRDGTIFLDDDWSARDGWMADKREGKADGNRARKSLGLITDGSVIRYDRRRKAAGVYCRLLALTVSTFHPSAFKTSTPVPRALACGRGRDVASSLQKHCPSSAPSLTPFVILVLKERMWNGDELECATYRGLLVRTMYSRDCRNSTSGIFEGAKRWAEDSQTATLTDLLSALAGSRSESLSLPAANDNV
ncbi:hypothetical protein DFH09DRAFT_1113062 [Mycena vulgaris]|nr:hypothetical protein DFH09DRAFT_1113062 [Mycena vulgaris]